MDRRPWEGGNPWALPGGGGPGLVRQRQCPDQNRCRGTPGVPPLLASSTLQGGSAGRGAREGSGPREGSFMGSASDQLAGGREAP